jgi:hypothetical protein
LASVRRKLTDVVRAEASLLGAVHRTAWIAPAPGAGGDASTIDGAALDAWLAASVTTVAARWRAAYEAARAAAQTEPR